METILLLTAWPASTRRPPFFSSKNSKLQKAHHITTPITYKTLSLDKLPELIDQELLISIDESPDNQYVEEIVYAAYKQAQKKNFSQTTNLQLINLYEITNKELLTRNHQELTTLAAYVLSDYLEQKGLVDVPFTCAHLPRIKRQKHNKSFERGIIYAHKTMHEGCVAGVYADNNPTLLFANSCTSSGWLRGEQAFPIDEINDYLPCLKTTN